MRHGNGFDRLAPTTGAFLGLVLLVGTAGCTMGTGDPNRNAGPNGQRYSCAGTKLNEVYSHSVDYDGGRANDWRFILIGQQGIMTVTCHFDEIDAKTVVNLRNAVGHVLATQLHNGQPRQEVTARVKEGKYYIEVAALESGSASTYTCEPKFDPVIWD